MAYLTLARIDGDPDAMLDGYRRSAPLMDSVGRDCGLLVHAGARTPEGLLVVNLWPSKEHSEAASRHPQRLAVVRGHGLRPEQHRAEHHDVERYVVFG